MLVVRLRDYMVVIFQCEIHSVMPLILSFRPTGTMRLLQPFGRTNNHNALFESWWVYEGMRNF